MSDTSQATSKITEASVKRLEIPAVFDGMRLDQTLAQLINDRSRVFLQGLIADGQVIINNTAATRKTRVREGDLVQVNFPAVFENVSQAEDIAMDVIYEDEDILVLNKPAGRVVHPGAGNAHGTLMNALLGYDRALFALPRAGIVHRLDKDTSGLMVVSRNEVVRQKLISLLKEHRVRRRYLALVEGRLISGGTVDAPIGRHRQNRLKMTVTRAGKRAVSHYRVVRRLRAHTLVRVDLETGRTHQIRVHMAHIGHPLFADPLYGRRLAIAAGMDEVTREVMTNFKRQALHAEHLEFDHPVSGRNLRFDAPLPDDFRQLLAALDDDNKKAAS
ncbi:MAG: pseudouridine synthase [marine bacterium B5-7]|nr:MAG: pseudouridine synthase [marine bacterium B5-7]